MSPRTPVVGLAVVAAGGVAVALTATTAPATAAPYPADTSAASSAALSATDSVLTDDSVWELPLSDAGLSHSTAAAGPGFKTGDLPADRVVPLQDFRVGPFYGATGGPHSTGAHSGLDMGARSGEPVYAVSEGKVIAAEYQGAAGQAVTIKTEDGKQVLYGHLSKIIAKKGRVVTAGDKIGLVGSTGNSTGPHLHLQVSKKNGRTMDPLQWLGVSAKALVEEGRT